MIHNGLLQNYGFAWQWPTPLHLISKKNNTNEDRKRQSIDITIAFHIKQESHDVHNMYTQKNHADCKMQNLRSKILSRYIFSFNINFLVVLFPIKLLNQLKQYDFNKPKVRNWFQSLN